MSAAQPGKFRRTLRLVAGYSMIGAFAFWLSGFFTEESRVREICAQIQPGMTLPSLREFARRHRMSKPTTENGSARLALMRSFGGRGCEVDMVNGIVRTVKYSASN